MKLHKIGFLLNLVLFLVHGGVSAQANIRKLNEQAQRLAEAYLKDENIAGMSISISWSDSIIFSKGFGFSNIESQILVQPSRTRFRIASITKTLTAATVARLSELQQIDFRKSVGHYLDSLPKKQYDFSVAEVGGHVAGLKRVPSAEKYTCDNQYGRKDFYRVYASDNLLFPPSTQFSYSNYGYKLLGLVVEKVTGVSIAENHKKYIIDVIGLKNTVPEDKAKDGMTAKFYVKNKGELVPAPCLDCTFKYAQGCYLSTSEDLVILGNAYLHPNRILQKETLVEILKPRKLVNGQSTNYGFGFGVSKDFYGNLCYGHTGGYEGSSSSLLVYPGSKLVIAILINGDVKDINALATKISNNYISRLK
ncbi:MAG TPA: serine hydrolase domain-containing protein [Flavobacterium sp.]|jgi:CubicO group peptidase (beta-lactamase class C family)